MEIEGPCVWEQYAFPGLPLMDAGRALLPVGIIWSGVVELSE